MGRPAQGYYIDGKRIPSVTTITGRFKDSGALMFWANAVGLGERDCDDQEPCRHCGRRKGKNHREAMNKAADVGKYAHALIEERVKGVEYEPADFAHLTPEQLELAGGCIEAFDNWWGRNVVEVVATELSLVSTAHRFGGTLDALCIIDDKLTLVDWKTSAGVYADYLAQLGGYLILVEENGMGPIEQLEILRISKETAGFDHLSRPRKALQPALDYFLKARDLYEADKALAKLLK